MLLASRRVPGATRFSFGIRVLLLSGGLAVTGGCGFLRRPETPIDRTSDARILSEVAGRINGEPDLAARGIRIEVDGAIVRLYGTVAGMGEWHCAIRNAQIVSGVTTVVDYLMIERGPRTSACLALPDVGAAPAGATAKPVHDGVPSPAGHPTPPDAAPFVEFPPAQAGTPCSASFPACP